MLCNRSSSSLCYAMLLLLSLEPLQCNAMQCYAMQSIDRRRCPNLLLLSLEPRQCNAMQCYAMLRNAIDRRRCYALLLLLSLEPLQCNAMQFSRPLSRRYALFAIGRRRRCYASFGYHWNLCNAILCYAMQCIAMQSVVVGDAQLLLLSLEPLQCYAVQSAVDAMLFLLPLEPLQCYAMLCNRPLSSIPNAILCYHWNLRHEMQRNRASMLMLLLRSLEPLQCYAMQCYVIIGRRC